MQADVLIVGWLRGGVKLEIGGCPGVGRDVLRMQWDRSLRPRGCQLLSGRLASVGAGDAAITCCGGEHAGVGEGGSKPDAAVAGACVR